MNKFRHYVLTALLITLPAAFFLATLRLDAVELNIAPVPGPVKNVPLQSPYNGCLIVRDGPGMDSPVKGYVANGDAVTIDSTSGSWYRISSPLVGYVWASYIEVTDSQTVDSANLTRPLGLETIVDNSNPESRMQKLPERQKLLEDNQVIELNIDQEINP